MVRRKRSSCQHTHGNDSIRFYRGDWQKKRPGLFIMYGVGEWNHFETRYITPCQWSLHRSACLGSKILIFGKHFQNDTNMSCIFNSTGGREVAISAIEHSFAHVICPVPNDFASGDEAVDVSLFDGNRVKNLYNPADLNGNRRVNITNPCWNGDVYPSIGPALGGLTLTLTGIGFCSLGSDCANAFLRQFQTAENASMVVYSKPSIRASTLLMNRFFSYIRGAREKAQLRVKLSS